MSKFKLAVFGHFPWSSLALVPLQIFYKEGLLAAAYAKDMVAQWVYPHLTALSYLRHHQTVFRQGADLRELWVIEPPYIAIEEVQTTTEPHADVLNLVHEMMNLRQKMGSFGGYTISTLLSMLALQDFQDRWPHLMVEECKNSISEGIQFVEFNYFNDRVPY